MNEQEMRQGIAALDAYKAQLDGILEQQQLVQMSLEEYSRAKATLSEFMKAGEGDELWVPIGGSVFVRAKVVDNKNVLIGIGSAVTAQKGTEEAMQIIDIRVQEMLDAMKKLNESRNVIEMKSNQLSQMLQSEYQAMGQQGPM